MILLILDIKLEEMLKLKIDVKNIDKEKLKDHYKRILMKSMFKMEEIAIRKAPVDTGYLRQNITLYPELLSNNYVLTSGAEYSEDLEFGNTPRDVKSSDIKKWIKRKGIATNPGAIESATFYITNKIKTQGVNAQPFMRPAFWEVKNIWVDVFAKQEF